MKILIIGYGKIGRAIAASLREGHNVICWDKAGAALPGQKHLPESAAGAEIIYLCVPTKSIKEALARLQPFLDKTELVVTLSKGIEPGSNKFAYQIIEEILPGQPYALLNGPMLAGELQDGKKAAAVVASLDQRSYEIISDSFSEEKIILEYSKDVEAVALAGVLKNVYTILIGVACGLGYEKNIYGYLVAKAANESRKITEPLGLDPEVMLGTAGLADLVATSSKEYSQNFQAGIELSKGNHNAFSEGMYSLDSLRHIIKTQQFPLLQSVIDIAVNGEDPQATLGKILTK